MPAKHAVVTIHNIGRFNVYGDQIMMQSGGVAVRTIVSILIAMSPLTACNGDDSQDSAVRITQSL